MKRYAVYYAPPIESALHRVGSAVLGRDAWSGTAVAQPAFDGVPHDRVAAITAAPRLYGFHATLKPPFAPVPECTAAEIAGALETFAAGVPPFDAPALRLAEIGGFLALVPRAESPELSAFAERAVRAFEPFRAPLSAAEHARRAHAPLDVRERELLAAWGYPYVLDRWRFHLTLTGQLEPSERSIVRAALEPLVAPLCCEPLRIDALALFVQPEAGLPFRCAARFPLGARVPV